VRIRIDARDLPGRSWCDHPNVHVGVQRGREPWALVPGDAPSATWVLDDVKPFLQGRKDDRFVYLTWGDVAPDGTFEMFRRAKLLLVDVPEDLGDDLVARLALTDARGGPRCARVRPPDVEWSRA
jgi:hypothetical protein